MKKLALWIVSISILVSACNQQESEEKTTKDVEKSKKASLLPTSTGSEYEVFVFGDQIKSKPELKQAIDSVLGEIVPALPQVERLYLSNFINIRDINASMQKNIKILFVSSGEDNTYNFLKKEVPGLIGKDSKKNSRENIWSAPQMVIHINGADQNDLISNLYKNRSSILELFEQNTTEKLKDVMYENAPTSKLTKLMKERHKVFVDLPNSYKSILEVYPGKQDSILEQFGIKGLSWYRSDTKNANNNILIYYFDYDPSILNDINKIFDIKNKMGKLVQSEKENTSMDIDTSNYYYYARNIKVNGLDVIELRGLWSMKNDWMGGPYIDYIIPDIKNNRIIYIDAFIYAPGSKKKRFIKRLEVILETFRLV